MRHFHFGERAKHAAERSGAVGRGVARANDGLRDEGHECVDFARRHGGQHGRDHVAAHFVGPCCAQPPLQQRRQDAVDALVSEADAAERLHEVLQGLEVEVIALELEGHRAAVYHLVGQPEKKQRDMLACPGEGCRHQTELLAV
ncbi:sigma-70 family RNA polymerase sigma factor [Babesia caballi]|uniref:Sigma-70 family RNA polymerase sigma factor n=1 Tax=Babesia caballi TaxID=5871 RepID=A0AAV4LVE6_BABCB|nr:sigma-70 family RNA polymerase sigma factor [Babesia caballi]